MSIAIIGGGIAGLTVAYHLVRGGETVDIYEKNDIVADECSFANGGQISACNFQTLHTLSNLKKGLFWLFKKDAPLHISQSLDLDKIRWITKFLGTTIQGKNFENSIKTLDLAMLSRREYKKYFSEFSREEVGHSPAYKGMLRLFDSQKDMDAAHSMIEMIEDYNYDKDDTNKLKFREVRTKEIDLPNFGSEIVGGYLFKDDGIADINALCEQMLTYLQTTPNFTLHINSAVTYIEKTSLGSNILLVNGEHSNGIYESVVIATGWRANILSKQFGTTLNLYPVKGYSISIECYSEDKAPDYSLLHDSKKLYLLPFDIPMGG